MSPAQTRGWQPNARPTIGDEGLMQAFLRPDRAGELTGVDFTVLDSVAYFGVPPTTFTYLLGSGVDPEAVSDALLARDFTRFDLAGMAAFECGADGAIDLEGREPGDPFDGGIGRSQRIAVADHRLLATASSEALGLLSPMLRHDAEPTALGSLLRSMALAAGEVTSGTAYVAHGYTIEVFAGSTSINLQDLTPEIEASAPAISYPPFGLALMIGSIGEQTETAQIVLSFDDKGGAAEAADEVAERLAEFKIGQRESGGEVDVTVLERESVAIAIISIAFARSDDRPSFRELRLWLNATQLREFTVLDPFHE